MYYNGDPSTRWALATADMSIRIDVMHSGDDLAFPDTNLAWWYQNTESDVFELDYDMKVFKLDEEEVGYSFERDFLKQQEDNYKMKIIFVIGSLVLLLIFSALVIVFILRRGTLSDPAREIRAEENPVYGDSYYDHSILTDLNSYYEGGPVLSPLTVQN